MILAILLITAVIFIMFRLKIFGKVNDKLKEYNSIIQKEVKTNKSNSIRLNRFYRMKKKQFKDCDEI